MTGPRKAARDEGTMGFLDHLDELRMRLIRSCIAVMLGMLTAFLFIDRLAEFVLAPTRAALPPGTSLIGTRLGEGFSFYFDVALIGGVVLAAPFVLFQIWRFVAPGLYTQERRLALPFVAVATVGTVAGFLFAHYWLFPSMVAFLAGFSPPGVKVMPTVDNTFGQYKNMVLAMIAVFQLPTLVMFLARMRLVTPRFLWSKIEYAVLIAFIAGALLTPSLDPWNQLLLAGPILAMYVISIGVAWCATPRGKRSSIGHELRLVFAAVVLEYASRRRHVRV
jgi:sec-independent protein translocase protein TatC